MHGKLSHDTCTYPFNSFDHPAPDPHHIRLIVFLCSCLAIERHSRCTCAPKASSRVFPANYLVHYFRLANGLVLTRRNKPIEQTQTHTHTHISPYTSPAFMRYTCLPSMHHTHTHARTHTHRPTSRGAYTWNGPRYPAAYRTKGRGSPACYQTSAARHDQAGFWPLWGRVEVGRRRCSTA
jgi:hypothetical protein